MSARNLSQRVAAAVLMLAVGGCWLMLQDAVSAAKPGVESAGNNLSFPVIWAENLPITTLRGTFGEPDLRGEWWYWWGTTEDGTPLSAPPDPNDPSKLINGDPVPEGAIRAYLQKDLNNTWQAGTALGVTDPLKPVTVNWIDWGDNLESNDWYTTSKVRTEVVLYKDIPDAPMLEYGMRHVSGWGTDEVHGLAVAPASQPGGADVPEVVYPRAPGDPSAPTPPQATVYSKMARLTIQKLHVETRDDPDLSGLVWDPTASIWQNPGENLNLVNETPIYNMAVYEGDDGPGYYSAEINVKGKVIYGYTWDLKRLNERTENQGEAAGLYRVTFSLDDKTYHQDAPAELNTFFTNAEVMVPIAEELALLAAEADEGGSTGGAVGIVDSSNHLTYMDVMILDRASGGGKGGGGKGGGGKGGGGRRSLTASGAPEPTSAVLLMLGAGALVPLRRRNSRGR